MDEAALKAEWFDFAKRLRPVGMGIFGGKPGKLSYISLRMERDRVDPPIRYEIQCRLSERDEIGFYPRFRAQDIILELLPDYERGTQYETPEPHVERVVVAPFFGRCGLRDQIRDGDGFSDLGIGDIADNVQKRRGHTGGYQAMHHVIP